MIAREGLMFASKSMILKTLLATLALDGVYQVVSVGVSITGEGRAYC